MSASLRRTSTLRLGAALLLTCLSAVPAQAADVAAVLARAKQASGGPRLEALASLRMVGAVATGGMKGELESLSDVKRCRYLDAYVLGPVKGKDGFDGAHAWSQDSSGQSRLEEGANAVQGSVDEAFRRCFAYLYPERWAATLEDAGERTEGGGRFAVVRATPKDGRPFELWFDQATGLLARTIEKNAMDTVTVTYSDYRDVGGVKLAFALHQTNGETRYDQDITYAKAELDVPLGEAQFAQPPPPPPDYSIAGGKTSVTVPFELINNHIYVDVKLGGRGPFRLLCDTGGANVLTPPLAKQLGLTAEGALQGRGVGDKSEDTGYTKVSSLEVGDVRLGEQVFMVMPLESLSDVEGAPVLGLVGYEIFKRFVVTIDYEHGRLTMTVPSAFAYHGSGTVVPFKFNNHIPQVEGTLDGIPGLFDLDTGSRSTLTVLRPFAEKHELARRYGAHFEGAMGWGVGGPSRGLLARPGYVTLGAVRLEKPVVDLSTGKKGSFVDPYSAGNVGGGLLKRFTVTFDYTRQQVIFEPNASYGTPDVFDRSGFWLNRSAKGFQVMDVTAGGPAAEVGLKAGDVVVSIDGKPTTSLSLPDLRKRLRTDAPGTKLKLGVESGGKRREVTLVLRDLV